MAAQNKRLTDYIKGVIVQRFKEYEADDKPYSFSLTLCFRNNTPPDIKIATLSTGSDKFSEKFDEAVKQGYSLKADRMIFREYDDPELSHPIERTEHKQEIPFTSGEPTFDRPARKKQLAGNTQPPSLGIAEINSIVEQKTANLTFDLEKQKIQLQHERELDKKDKVIRDLTEELEKAGKENKELEERIEELELNLEEATNRSILDKIPLGQLLTQMGTSFLQKNPKFLSVLGIPDATPLLGIGEEAPAVNNNQVAERANDERAIFYDKLLQFYESLDDIAFSKFINVVVAIQNGTASIDDLYSLVTPANTNSQ